MLTSFKVFLNTRSTKSTYNNSPYFSDCTFKLNVPIKTKKNTFFKLSLIDAIIPISWFQISTYFNNSTLYFTVNSVAYNYTVPDGNYNIYTLITALTGNLQGISITFNSVNNKLTFVHLTYNFTLDFIQSNMHQELGFYNNIIYSSTSKTLTSALACDLSGSREIYVAIQNLSFYNIDSRDGNCRTHIIDHIGIDVNNFEILKYQAPTEFKTIVIDSRIEDLRVILTDDESNIIPLLHNYSMTLQFEEVLIKEVIIKENEELII